MTQLVLALEAGPQELLRLPQPLVVRALGEELLEQERWRAEAAQRLAWGQWLQAMPPGDTYDTVRGRWWHKGAAGRYAHGATLEEAREIHDTWVAAGCPMPRRDCQPSMPGYRTREAREARAAAREQARQDRLAERAAAKEKRTMDELSTRTDPLAVAVLAAHQGGTLSAEQMTAYLRKPGAWKLCSGAPSLGVEQHPQLRERFSPDSTGDGLYRMCKPCDSVTQRAYRIRLKLRAQGLPDDNRTVREILEAPILMPGKAAAPPAVAPRPVRVPARVPALHDTVVVLGVQYRITRLGVQADSVELTTGARGATRTSTCRTSDLSWGPEVNTGTSRKRTQGAWLVEDTSVAMRIATVTPAAASEERIREATDTPELRPAPKPSKSTPEQRARWAAAKREQRASKPAQELPTTQEGVRTLMRDILR